MADEDNTLTGRLPYPTLGFQPQGLAARYPNLDNLLSAIFGPINRIIEPSVIGPSRTSQQLERLGNKLTGTAGKVGEPTAGQTLIGSLLESTQALRPGSGRMVFSPMRGYSPGRGVARSNYPPQDPRFSSSVVDPYMLLNPHRHRSMPGLAEQQAIERRDLGSGFGSLNPRTRTITDLPPVSEQLPMSPRPIPRGPSGRVTLNQITDWLDQSNIPYRIDRGAGTGRATGTQYINARDSENRIVRIRVPSDRHIGVPIGVDKPGDFFDTGDVLAGPRHRETRSLSRNAAGESYSRPDVLFDALSHRFSTSPEGYRLIPPDRAPAQYVPPTLARGRERPVGEQREFLSRLEAMPSRRVDPVFRPNSDLESRLLESLMKGPGGRTPRFPRSDAPATLSPNRPTIEGDFIAPMSESRLLRSLSRRVQGTEARSLLRSTPEDRQSLLASTAAPTEITPDVIPPGPQPRKRRLIPEYIQNLQDIPPSPEDLLPRRRILRPGRMRNRQELLDTSPLLQEYFNRIQERRGRKK